MTENRNPDLYTPLQSEGDRITAFGVHGPDPLLYTGVCVLSRPDPASYSCPARRLSSADLWQPILDEGREELGFVLHHGPHADLGRPGDFLRASLEALARGGPFPKGAGTFDQGLRVLATEAAAGFDAADCVLGAARIARGASLRRCAVWAGASVGDGARLTDCLVARGRVPAGAHYAESLLFSADGGDVAARSSLRSRWK